MSTPRTRIALIEEKVVTVAEGQEGVIARRQIRECGTSDATVARWVKRGRLHRRHPGVYALGHRRITPRGELIAALLYAGPGAALAGLSGAAWWEITKPLPRVIDVATPHRRRSVPGVKVSFRPGLERVKHRGLPVVPVPRALLDLARLVPWRTLRRALAEADYVGLLDPEAVIAMCGPGQPGSKALRRALYDHLPVLADTRNGLEERFLSLCETSGLPLPEMNVEIGPFTVDARFHEKRLIVELDGGAAHGRPAAVVRDRNRELYLRERGYGVIRYSWLQVFEDPERVAADLRGALSATTRPACSRRRAR